MSHSSVYARIVLSKNFMRAYYAQAIDLNQVAAQAHLSKYHFVREFKNAYGRTPHQYLTEVRLEKAKELLYTSSNTVSDICFMVGFTSVSSFTGLFKKRMGLAPLAFRQKKPVSVQKNAGAFLKYPNGRFPGT